MSIGLILSLSCGSPFLQNIYDGIQRPLKSIAELSNSIYIPRGINTQALDRAREWEFTPTNYKVGDHISGGDIYGTVYENSLVSQHKIMLPPRAMGTITYLAEKGTYTIEVSPFVHHSSVSSGLTQVSGVIIGYYLRD